jgi:hypothetical protein
MATARIERNTNRHILNLVDAIDVRATGCGTWGFHHDCPTTSTFGAYCLLHHPLPTGHAGPWLGDKAKAERRAILPRDPVV